MKSSARNLLFDKVTKFQKKYSKRCLKDNSKVESEKHEDPPMRNNQIYSFTKSQIMLTPCTLDTALPSEEEKSDEDSKVSTKHSASEGYSYNEYTDNSEWNYNGSDYNVERKHVLDASISEKSQASVSCSWRGKIYDVSTLLNETSEANNSVHYDRDEKITKEDKKEMFESIDEKIENSVSSPFLGKTLEISYLLKERLQKDDLINSISDQKINKQTINDQSDNSESIISEISNLSVEESASCKEEPVVKIDLKLKTHHQVIKTSPDNEDHGSINFPRIKNKFPTEGNSKYHVNFINSSLNSPTMKDESLSTIYSVEDQSKSYSTMESESLEYISDFENSEKKEVDSSTDNDSINSFQADNESIEEEIEEVPATSNTQNSEKHISFADHSSTFEQVNSVAVEMDVKIDLAEERPVQQEIFKVQCNSKYTQTISMPENRQINIVEEKVLETSGIMEYGRELSGEIPLSMFLPSLNLLNVASSSNFVEGNFYNIAQQKLSVIKYIMDKQRNLYRDYMNAAAQLTSYYQPITLNSTKKMIEKHKKKRRKK